MKLAIMQPYFFPYIGYFQLINAVDKFVIFDDVQYINKGWINRNRILLHDRSFNIVLPIRKDSMKKKINERCFVDKVVKYKVRLLQQIEHAYKKAPFFNQIYPVISSLLFIDEENVSKFNTLVLSGLCGQLKIGTPFYISSELNKKKELSAEERMININQVMGSSIYINPQGGSELYNGKSFLNKGIELRFLKTKSFCYKQFDNNFIPNLSIIDLLMFNSLESVNELLNEYNLE